MPYCTEISATPEQTMFFIAGSVIIASRDFTTAPRSRSAGFAPSAGASGGVR